MNGRAQIRWEPPPNQLSAHGQRDGTGPVGGAGRGVEVLAAEDMKIDQKYGFLRVKLNVISAVSGLLLRF